MSKIDDTKPKVIFLQIEGAEPKHDFKDLGGVSWCSDKINENDLEYWSIEKAKEYTKEDREYFDNVELSGGVLSWDDKQELQEYREFLEAEKVKCNYCMDSKFNPHGYNDGNHELCPKCQN